MCRELEIGAKNLLDLLHTSCSYLTSISFVSSAAVFPLFNFHDLFLSPSHWHSFTESQNEGETLKQKTLISPLFPVLQVP